MTIAKISPPPARGKKCFLPISLNEDNIINATSLRLESDENFAITLPDPPPKKMLIKSILKKLNNEECGLILSMNNHSSWNAMQENSNLFCSMLKCNRKFRLEVDLYTHQRACHTSKNSRVSIPISKELGL